MCDTVKRTISVETYISESSAAAFYWASNCTYLCSNIEVKTTQEKCKDTLVKDTLQGATLVLADWVFRYFSLNYLWNLGWT